jgi:peptidyl-prolyl cis-trans isomerase SurA
MARRNSEEESSADVGGRVLDPQAGERDLFLNALGPSWQSTLDTMEVGEISQPAEAELLDGSRAYHIVKLQKWAPEHRVNLEQDYQFIKERALQEKQSRVLREWTDRLRDDVYIELRGKARRLSSSLAEAPSSQS